MRRMRFELTLLRVKATICDLCTSNLDWTIEHFFMLVNNNIDAVVYVRYACNIL